MKNLFFIWLTITCNLAFADACEAILQKAQEGQALIPGYQAMHTISGKTRAYFHNAPANTCINKQLFLVPGDSVVAYADYQEFTSVLYIHPKTGVETQDWVLTQRLQATSTGIAPQQH